MLLMNIQDGPKVILPKKIECFPYGSSKEPDFFTIDRDMLKRYIHKNNLRMLSSTSELNKENFIFPQREKKIFNKERTVY